MKSLIIYGAGGLGREVLSLARALPEWKLAGFFDDGLAPGSMVSGLPVLGGLDKAREVGKTASLAIAVGDPIIKSAIASKLASSGLNYATLIHPSVILQDPDSIAIEAGTIIGAGCILTCDIHVGLHCLINLNVTIGHNSQVGDCTSIMPGSNIAGNVSIGKEVMVGSGANIINKVLVGDRSRVGAGAVVISNLPPGVTAVGVPAKIIQK